jgi:outer membrane protein TolC
MAEESVSGAAYRKKAASAAYLPSLDFSGMYFYNQQQIELLGEDAKLPTMSFNPQTGSYSYNLVTDAQGVPVANPQTGSYIPSEVAVIPKDALSYDTHNVFAGAFTLTQPVYMGGQIRALNNITKYAEQLAQSMRNSAIQEVIYSVDEAYWQVVSLKEKKRLAESFVSLVDTLRYNVSAMKQEGVATESDMLTVEVKYNEAQIALTKVNNGLTLSRMALAQICGLPLSTSMELEDEDLGKTEHYAESPSVNMDEVYARRQDLSSIRHGISIFESKEKLEMGNMLPKVALIGAYAFSNPNVNHGFEKKFGGGFSVGATFTVPLWHWGGNYNNYRAAKAETNAQRLLLEDMEEKVDLQVTQARFSYDEAYKTYAMTLKNMDKADENLRNARYGFREGVLTADDVITAQTAWLQAHSEKIDAEIGIQLCRVYLSKVLGTLQY